MTTQKKVIGTSITKGLAGGWQTLSEEWKIGKSGNSDFNICIIAEDGGSICHISRWPDEEAKAKLIVKSPKMEAAIKKALSVKALWMNPINNSSGERAILKVILKQLEEAIS